MPCKKVAWQNQHGETGDHVWYTSISRERKLVETASGYVVVPVASHGYTFQNGAQHRGEPSGDDDEANDIGGNGEPLYIRGEDTPRRRGSPARAYRGQQQDAVVGFQQDLLQSPRVISPEDHDELQKDQHRSHNDDLVSPIRIPCLIRHGHDHGGQNLGVLKVGSMVGQVEQLWVLSLRAEIDNGI
ncbi:MAG: hypothetical protein Q9173_006457 [Seirophora scorigena]